MTWVQHFARLVLNVRKCLLIAHPYVQQLAQMHLLNSQCSYELASATIKPRNQCRSYGNYKTNFQLDRKIE